MIAVRVNGQTVSGSRTIKDPADWACECWMCEQHPQRLWTDCPGDCNGPGMPRRHAGGRYSCPDCGARRPT